MSSAMILRLSVKVLDRLGLIFTHQAAISLDACIQVLSGFAWLVLQPRDRLPDNKAAK
jgi:hypothetical protein